MNDILDVKICPRCKEVKPNDQFQQVKGKKPYQDAYCIPCRRAYYREFYNENYRGKG